MAKKRKPFVHTEEYEISFRFQNSEGFWRTGKETVVIPLVGEAKTNEKNNHERAEELFLKKNPKAQIINTTYC